MRNLSTLATAIALAAFVTVSGTGAGFAQTPAAPDKPATDKPAAAASAKTEGTSEAEKRAKAADCSKQADAKKLHGTAREKFRAACKKA